MQRTTPPPFPLHLIVAFEMLLVVVEVKRVGEERGRGHK